MRPTQAGMSWPRAQTAGRRAIALLTTPFVAGVVLPILTTLAGVYLALWLDNSKARSDEREKTAAILTVAKEECTEVQNTLSQALITDQPVFLPVLGLSLVNLLQQPGILRELRPEDFGALVKSLSGIQEAMSRYQRTSAEFHETEARPLPLFAPAMLPINPPTMTPAEAQAAFDEARTGLETKRAESLKALIAALQTALSDYGSSVSGFCSVTSTAADYL